MMSLRNDNSILVSRLQLYLHLLLIIIRLRYLVIGGIILLAKGNLRGIYCPRRRATGSLVSIFCANLTDEIILRLISWIAN